ncbi:MAG: 30S ribosomal protein S14 [Gemmatimonadaceae bacterium]
MAKTSKKVKNEQRAELVKRYGAKRKALREKIRNPKTSDEARAKAYAQLRDLPRNSAAIRLRNRCAMTGRSRGFVRAFGLSRMAMRDMALNGLLPGVRKASW